MHTHSLFFIIFCRLVDKVNKFIEQDPKFGFFVGVVDIYGFESSKGNMYLFKFPDDQQAIILECAYLRSQIHF